MKKILSVLAAVGLTATASTAVVACTTTLSGKDVTVARDTKSGDYTITTDSFKAELAEKAGADVKKDATVAKADLKADFGHLVWFDKDKKAIKFTTKGAAMTDETVTATKDIKKGDKKINIKMTIVLNAAAAQDLGLVDANGKAGKNVTLTLASVNKDGKQDKVLFKLALDASKFAFTPATK